MLVLSASPAQAFGPQEPAPETEQTLPGTEPTDNTEAPGGVEGSDDVDGVDGSESTAPEGTVEESPGETEAEVDPEAATEAEETTGPAESESAESDGEKSAADEDEAEVEGAKGEQLKHAPKAIDVDGTILFIPNEPTPAQEMGLEPIDEGTDLSAGDWMIATTEGPLLTVDPSGITGEAGSTVAVEVTVPVSAAVQAEIQAEIEENGSASLEGALEKIAAEAGETGVATPVTGEVIAITTASDTPLGAAPAKRSHSADVMYVGSTNKKTYLTNLLKDASNYWKTQSNGAIPSISMANYKTMSSSSTCNQQTLWKTAASKFGRTVESYQSGARHLIVFVENGYCNAAGLGSVGKIHTGGTVWVDLKGNTTNKGPLKVLAHEIGHNLSLGHSQARYCSSGVDTSVSLQSDNQTTLRVYKPKSPCRDIEYGDAWSLMGTGLPGGAPAVSTAQKAALGVLPSGSTRTVTAAGGRTQTFKINGAGAASGLRGLKVNTPSGGSFYVEYRNGRGQDAGSQIQPGSDWVNSAGPLHMSTGVQVVKSYATAKQKWRWSNGYRTWHTWENYQYPRSTAIPFRSGSDLYITGKAGQATIPFSSNARVRVVSMTANQATVRVEFTPFIDVPYNHKFGKEINWMSSAKLSTGIKSGSVRKYAPKDKVTREAMAAFLYRLNTPKGAKAPKGYKIPKKSPFKDVSTKHKFYKEIAWMSTSGLSTGIKTSAGRIYAPKAGVTREAMAAFIYRMDKTKKPATLKKSPFSDMTTRTKFYKEAAWMYQTGLSTGVKQKKGKPKYLPKANVTREAMAAFIYRLKH